jgi:hypothetical protein
VNSIFEGEQTINETAHLDDPSQSVYFAPPEPLQFFTPESLQAHEAFNKSLTEDDWTFVKQKCELFDSLTLGFTTEKGKVSKRLVSSLLVGEQG